MDFPIEPLIDEERWVLNHFHPQGLRCPECQAGVAEARDFRKTATSVSKSTGAKAARVCITSIVGRSLRGLETLLGESGCNILFFISLGGIS